MNEPEEKPEGLDEVLELLQEFKQEATDSICNDEPPKEPTETK